MKKKDIYKRQINHLCPNCMSTLTVENGDYVCTGDRLEIWQKVFEEFDKMQLKEKRDYLSSISDQDKFFDLYKQKSKLTCDFSTYRASLVPNYNETILDPLVVKRVQKSLGRPLTDEEKSGDTKLYRRGNDYKTRLFLGYEEFEIPRINFPEDL